MKSVMRGQRDFPWSSESAVRYVDRVPAATRFAIVGDGKDYTTPPVLSVAYPEALRLGANR